MTDTGPVGQTTRCGVVALIGEPNAGKSTLLNRMVGAKISIVTHKVQTTRARIRGIAMEGAAQLIFVDTPGLFRPRRRLDRAMVKAAWGGAADADITVLLIEAHRGLTGGVREILDTLGAQLSPKARVALAINKIDRVPAEKLLALSAEMNAARDFAATFMISAERGHGVADLRRWLAAEVPPGPWLYPEDQIADLPLRLIAAEMTREKLTLRLHQELPYELTVETEGWEEREDGSVRKAHDLPFGFSMMLPAFRGVPAVSNIEGLTNPRGFIIVDKHQRNPAFPEIFALGVCVAIPPTGPTPVPVGVPKTGFMIESMVTAIAANLSLVLDGQEPTAEATWNAVCLADFGDGGVAFVAQPQIPPRNVNWSSSGKWVHLAKVGFEKYFLRKVRKGESEPFYEKLAMHAMGIRKLRF